MTKKKKRKNIQLDLFPTGQELRDIGIERAVDHANRVVENWSDKAYAFFLMFLDRHQGQFMAEYVRAAAAGIVPDPPDARAWGGILAKAAKDGKIKSLGYVPQHNPQAHRSPKNVWVKI